MGRIDVDRHGGQIVAMFVDERFEQEDVRAVVVAAVVIHGRDRGYGSATYRVDDAQSEALASRNRCDWALSRNEPGWMTEVVVMQAVDRLPAMLQTVSVGPPGSLTLTLLSLLVATSRLML